MARVNTSDQHRHPKEPSFLTVVIAATVALFLLFILALVILSMRGKKDLPLNHKNNRAEIQWLAQERALPARNEDAGIYRL